MSLMDNNNYPENDGVGNGNLIMDNNKKSASTCWKIMRVPIYSILTVVAAALQAVSFKKAGYSSPVRKPRGVDIMAACGQLKSNSIRKKVSNKI